MQVQTISVLLTLVFSLSYASVTMDAIRVRTTSGILHGKRTTTLQKSLTQFLGVPYAKPPVGTLRFKAPAEITTENIDRNAANYAASCYQPPHLKSVISPLLKPNEAEISEDCLYLNIFVPDLHEVDSPLPVMVWLPGEGFDYADPQQFDGSYLAVLGKVIVVTVNYRVSVFGFLSTLSKDAPGNVGLLDQRMALQWLKKNIAKFGGDVDNITLFGRFSGAMSIGIHAFSPLNKNEKLFHRAILQSGVPVGDWVIDRNPLNATLRLAEQTNCLFSSLTDITTCLRRIPSDILLKKSLTIGERWRPVYDYHLIHEYPLRVAENGNYESIDFLLGVNKNEGSLCTIALNALRSPFYSKLLKAELTKNDFQELVESNMMEIFKKKDYLLNKLAVHEYADGEMQSKLRESFVKFCGDLYVTSHVQKLADILAENSKGRVYMYEFAHRPSFSIHPSFVKAGHGDDVLFTLGLPFQLPELPEDEARLTRKTVEAVSEFARKGNPNSPKESSAQTWPEYTVRDRRLMTFTTSKTLEGEEVVKRSSHETAVSFWHDVIPAVERRPCPLAGAEKPFIHQRRQGHPDSGTLNGSPSSTPAKTAYFLGSAISLTTAECLLFGLFCTTIFLVLTLTATVLLVYRSQSHSSFKRLR